MPHFSELSEAAQFAIVDAAMIGKPNIDLPDTVRAEIKAWADSDDFAATSKPKGPTRTRRCRTCPDRQVDEKTSKGWRCLACKNITTKR